MVEANFVGATDSKFKELKLLAIGNLLECPHDEVCIISHMFNLHDPRTLLV